MSRLQDLKAAMLEGRDSIFAPDIIIDDENLINDERWSDVKETYEKMFTEKDIQKIMGLSNRDFRDAYKQLPITAKNIIISTLATQIESGNYEQFGKAKIVDEISGTRFDLKMA